ncbi:MAG: hypothetical protein Tp133SUR523431_23 [Prokaryotic dsDNA virus sp.]|nr:MAG: hypothetical protein Tp133SUR523431_23 [Prokaryotic dsDNA virus sp.]|tara:strand:- start:3616 stop:10908 length:7293 start_codon:yes stop_codon:yes gene_type:complete
MAEVLNNTDINENSSVTLPNDPPVEENNQQEDPPTKSLLKPIISESKVKQYWAGLGGTSIPISPNQYSLMSKNYSFFSDKIDEYKYTNNLPILSDDEKDKLYNSFRDTEAEQAEADRINSLYLAKNLTLDNFKDLNIPATMSGPEVLDGQEIMMPEDMSEEDIEAYKKEIYKQHYKGILESNRILYNYDYTDEDIEAVINGEKSLDELDGGATTRTSLSYSSAGLQEKYKRELDRLYKSNKILGISDDNVELFAKDKTYQLAFRQMRANHLLTVDPFYDFSYNENSTFVNMARSLDVNFMLMEAPDAAEVFNMKFEGFGYTAKPVVQSNVPGIERQNHALQIFDTAGNLVMETKLYGGDVFGIDKETLLEMVGTPEITDTPGVLQTIIRPQVYAQAFENFLTEFDTATKTANPAKFFADGYALAENKQEYIFNRLANLQDLGFASNNMIVNIAKEIGIDIDRFDFYKAYKDKNGGLIYDYNAANNIIIEMMNELRQDSETPGVEIRLQDPNIKLDKDGILQKINYDNQFGVNDADALYNVLGQSDNLNDTIIDRYGNKRTVREILTKSMSNYVERLRVLKTNASKTAGIGLKMNGAFKDIPLDGPQAYIFASLANQNGFDIFSHMPTEAITINGAPANYEQLFNIMTDPSLRNQARSGQLKISIGNPQDYGVLAPMVIAAKELVDRNNGDFSGIMGLPYDSSDGENAFEATQRYFDDAYEWIEDGLQNVYFTILDMGGSMKEISRDALRATGMNEALIEFMLNKPMLYPLAVPGGPPMTTSFSPGPFDKKYVEELREEYLPLWTTRISDANTIGEFMWLANQQFSTSMVYLGAMFINPYFGLSTIGVNSYGETLYSYHDRRNMLEEAKASGVALTEIELNNLETSDWAIRAIAGVNAGIETGFTALFTYNYLRQAGIWKKSMKNIDPKTMTQEKIKEIAENLQRNFDKSVNNQFSKFLGGPVKAATYELAEENNIAAWTYMVEAWTGQREFDQAELGKLLQDTSYHTVFSSMGMSVAVSYGKNKKTLAMADLFIEGNITTSNYYGEAEKMLSLSKSLDEFVQSELKKGTKMEDIKELPSYKSFSELIQQSKNVIEGIQKSRKQLVSKMSKGDKVRFLNLLTDLETNEATLQATSKGSDARILALNKIKAIKEELADIVSNIGDASAFEFLSREAKEDYISMAFNEMNFEQELDENPNLTEEDFYEKLEERAKELYVLDFKIKEDYLNTYEIPSVDVGNIARTYGNIDVSEIETKPIDKKFLAKFDLRKNLDQELEKLNKLVIKPEGVDLENTQEGEQTTAPVEQGPKTENEALQEKLLGILNRINSYTAAETNEFIESFDLNRFRGKKRDLNLDRKDFGHFHNGKVIMRLFETLQDADIKNLTFKDFEFQRIEALLNSYDIAMQISSQIQQESQQPFGEKVTGGARFNPLNWGKMFRRAMLKFYAKPLGFKEQAVATKDILKQLLIRDRNIASPWTNLYEEINRKISVATKQSNDIYNDLFNYYVSEKNKGKFFLNKTDYKSATIEDDYEMSLLAGLARINLDGVSTTEFQRYQKVVKEELDLRRREADGAFLSGESRYSKTEAKRRYELLLNATNKLRFFDAKSFEDVTQFAESYNLEIITRLQGHFKDGEQDAKNRVYGFGGEWTNFDNYLPLFLTDSYGPDTWMTPTRKYDMYGDPASQGFYKGVPINTAGALQFATTPDSYEGTGFRLQFGGFLRNSVLSLKGSKIDATGRQDMETLVYLFNNPEFASLFEDQQDYDLFKFFFADQMKNDFNYQVNQGRNPYTDFGDQNLWKEWSDGEGAFAEFKKNFAKTVNTLFTGASAVSLGSLTQPTQQYYSAMNNSYLRAESPEARQFFTKKMMYFSVGLAGLTNSSKRGGWITQGMRDILGIGDMSNIFNQSQVSLRNSIRAELPLSQDQRLDISYYETKFNLDAGFFGKYGVVPSKYTFDELMNVIQSNAELSLNFFLARTDKVAANASFLGHYLDFKIRNGSKYPAGTKARKEWWAKENENPDIGAINYADGIVKEIMRPSSDMTEAPLYKDNNTGTQMALQTLYPFAKFQINAKTQFWTQYSIYMDESLPQDQRDAAYRTMLGIGAEIATFQATKTGLGAVLYGNLASVLLGFDEEEIERKGGLTGVLFETLLPIDDRAFMNKLDERFKDMTVEEINTIEGLNAYYRLYQDHYIGEDFAPNLELLQTYMNTYQNKSDASPKNNNIIRGVFGDVIETLNPTVFPPVAYDFAFGMINHTAQEYGIIEKDSKIFLEFASEDLYNAEGEFDFGGVRKVLEENLGLLGIVGDQWTKIKNALNLMEKNQISKRVPGGATQTQYVGTGSPAINEKIDQAIATIFIMRMASSLNLIPGAPNAEIDRIAEKMYRQLEKYLNTTTSQASGESQSRPDPEMKTNFSRYWETLEEQKEKRSKEPLNEPN